MYLVGELEEEAGSLESRRRSIVAWSKSFIEFFLLIGPRGFPAAKVLCIKFPVKYKPRGRYCGRPRNALPPVSSMKCTDRGDAGMDTKKDGYTYSKS